MNLYDVLNNAEEIIDELDAMSDKDLLVEFDKLELYCNLYDVEDEDYAENFQTKALIEMILHLRGYHSKTIFLNL